MSELDQRRHELTALERVRHRLDPELLVARFDLAQLELTDGDPGRAVSLLRDLVATHTEIDGPTGDDTLECRGFLGRALTEARLYGDAEAVLRQLVIDRTAVLGTDHPLTFVARGNLVRAIGRGGRPEEALLLAEALLDDRTRVLGPDHPETLQTRGHIAQLHGLAGRVQESRQMHAALLADRTRVLGADHPDVLTSAFNLSTTGRPADALAQARRMALQVGETLGTQHPDALLARGVLAQRLLEDGAHLEALTELRPLFTDRIRVLGELHPAVQTTHRMLARALSGLGRTDEALGHLQTVVRVLTATLGAAAIDTLEARADLVAALPHGDQRHAAALALQLDARSTLEPTHPQMLVIDALARRARPRPRITFHRH